MFQGTAQAQSPSSDGVSIPAPIGGVNAVDPLSSMPSTDAIYLYNLIHSQYGLKVRRGYRAWVTGLTGGAVRTLIPYTRTGGANEFYACTPSGIWDISSSTGSPSIDTAFGTTTGLAGWGIWTQFTILGGQYIALCDEVNGYYTYNGTSWTNIVAGAGAGEINGANPDNFVFVCAWKDRLLFVERDTATMWYLPVGQVTGTVTSFNFGTKFKHGGYLIGLYNWTIDGGEGVDDYLVALSSGGDVVVYKGTDPSSATNFTLQGQWYVGGFPAGRRVASSFGGDLLLITSNGVIPLSVLFSGSDVALREAYHTKKISPVVNSLLKETLNSRGWEINLLPRDDLFLIATPKRTGYPYIQYAQGLTSQGWSFLRDMPYVTGANWLGDLYFGDESGNVYVHSGTLDNVNLAGTSYSPIEFSLLTSFQHLGVPTRYKRVDFIRPVFLSGGSPVYDVKAVYDYNLLEINLPAGTPPVGEGWDSAEWDVNVWGGTIEALESVRGATGIGRNVAIAMRGTTTQDLILIQIDMMLTIGGHL